MQFHNKIWGCIFTNSNVFNASIFWNLLMFISFSSVQCFVLYIKCTLFLVFIVLHLFLLTFHVLSAFFDSPRSVKRRAQLVLCVAWPASRDPNRHLLLPILWITRFSKIVLSLYLLVPLRTLYMSGIIASCLCYVTKLFLWVV